MNWASRSWRSTSPHCKLIDTADKSASIAVMAAEVEPPYISHAKPNSAAIATLLLSRLGGPRCLLGPTPFSTQTRLNLTIFARELISSMGGTGGRGRSDVWPGIPLGPGRADRPGSASPHGQAGSAAGPAFRAWPGPRPLSGGLAREGRCRLPGPSREGPGGSRSARSAWSARGPRARARSLARSDPRSLARADRQCTW